MPKPTRTVPVGFGVLDLILWFELRILSFELAVRLT